MKIFSLLVAFAALAVPAALLLAQPRGQLLVDRGAAAQPRDYAQR